MKKTTKKMTVDTMTIIRRINGLSVGDVARCGEYGTIKCTHAAVRPTGKGCKMTKGRARQFSVSGSKLLKNGGLWTMSKFRAAILSK